MWCKERSLSLRSVAISIYHKAPHILSLGNLGGEGKYHWGTHGLHTDILRNLTDRLDCHVTGNRFYFHNIFANHKKVPQKLYYFNFFFYLLDLQSIYDHHIYSYEYPGFVETFIGKYQC